VEGDDEEDDEVDVVDVVGLVGAAVEVQLPAPPDRVTVHSGTPLPTEPARTWTVPVGVAVPPDAEDTVTW
jgi:hypothetical protein